MLLAVVVVMALRHRTPAVAPDPLAGLPLQAAADSAGRKIGRGDHAGSLPYFDHIEREAGSDDPVFEMQAAAAAYNATFQVRARDGFAIPATRSTIERVGLVKHALERLDFAERNATGPPIQRDAITARGAQLAVWGFVREAFAEYRRAQSVMPLAGRPLDEAAWLQRMLADPRIDQPPPIAPGGASDSPPRPERAPADSTR